MLKPAIALFVIAAIFGLVVLINVMGSKPTPKWAVIMHGLFAAAGLLLTIVFVAKAAGASPTASLVLLVVAALGGFTLAAIDLQKKAVPKWLALVHPLIAAAGLIMLIRFVA